MAAPRLSRELGLFSAALLVVGGIIGSGIFFTPAEVARALPGPGPILAVWIAGGLIALAGALTYAELGAMLPDAGGGYVYIREAFGPLPAFLCGWMTLGLTASGAIAAVAMGFAGYAERYMPLDAVGSYRLEDDAGLIASIDGTDDGVIGLPIVAVRALLSRFA